MDISNLTSISAENAPVQCHEDGTLTIHISPKLTGITHTMPYDSLLWRFSRIPFFRTPQGELVMLDMGMVDLIRVTADRVEDGNFPSHIDETVSFAYIPSHNLGDIELHDCLAVIETNTWEWHFLGLPIYRVKGWVLGSPLLRQTSYLAFNNLSSKVTIGFEPFDPLPNLEWQNLEITFTDGRPYISINMAEAAMKLLVDSAGGPAIILNQSEWSLISDRVKISKHTKKSYPGWGKPVEVDVYRIKTLMLGDLEIEDKEIWVRQDSSSGLPPLIGLGVFEDAVVVWDFKHRLFWVGIEKDESSNHRQQNQEPEPAE